MATALDDLDRAASPRAVAAGDVLTQAAGVGLHRRAPDRVRLPDDAASAVIGEAVRQRLTSHLVAAIDAETVQASAFVRKAAAAAHRRAVRHVLHLEQVLLRAVDILAAAGVDVRLLKGPAVARTLYPQIGMRTFIDVDLLVRSDDIDRSISALVAAGYRRPVPELRPGFDRRFGKSAMVVDPTGIQVDLHRTLVVGPFGLLVDLGDLFSAARPVTLGGRTMQTLDAVPEFLALCYHAALGDVPPRLASLRDVAQALERAPEVVAPAVDVAARWSGRAVVARAITMTASAFDLAPTSHVAWARSFRPDRRERRLLACYVSEQHSNARKYLASARTISDPVDTIAYLAALVFPRSEVLSVYGRHRGRWLWHGVRSLLRTTTRAHDGRPERAVSDAPTAASQ